MSSTNYKAFRTSFGISMTLAPMELKVQINHKKLDHQVEATTQGHLAKATIINP